MREEREGCAGVCMGRDSVCGRAGRDVDGCRLSLAWREGRTCGCGGRSEATLYRDRHFHGE